MNIIFPTPAMTLVGGREFLFDGGIAEAGRNIKEVRYTAIESGGERRGALVDMGLTASGAPEHTFLTAGPEMAVGLERQIILPPDHPKDVDVYRAGGFFQQGARRLPGDLYLHVRREFRDDSGVAYPVEAGVYFRDVMGGVGSMPGPRIHLMPGGETADAFARLLFSGRVYAQPVATGPFVLAWNVGGRRILAYANRRGIDDGPVDLRQTVVLIGEVNELSTTWRRLRQTVGFDEPDTGFHRRYFVDYDRIFSIVTDKRGNVTSVDGVLVENPNVVEPSLQVEVPGTLTRIDRSTTIILRNQAEFENFGIDPSWD